MSQMGIILTNTGMQNLKKLKTNTAEAEAALSLGINAQRQGTEVEALSYYIQAVNFDPGLAEANSRLNILAVDVNSGNIGVDVRNDLEWRERWISRLNECETFYYNSLNEWPPYYIVYSTNIRRGIIDYEKGIVSLVLRMGAFPVVSWFSTLNQVVLAVKNGLESTGRAGIWGIYWPEKTYRSPSPFLSYFNAYTVVLEIINSNNELIAGGPVNLIYGWEVDIRKNVFVRPIGGTCDITFDNVDPYKITDKLSIRIASINGVQAEKVETQMRISIITEDEYIRMNSTVF
jgi:hypothetical protein